MAQSIRRLNCAGPRMDPKLLPEAPDGGGSAPLFAQMPSLPTEQASGRAGEACVSARAHGRPRAHAHARARAH
eukprot:1645199-Alexandrium_andersonii.AAC.1